MDLETLIIRVRAMADGVQEGVDNAKASLKGLDSANAQSAAKAKKAAQDAATGYKLAAIEAEGLAIKAKTAGEQEKAALEETARKARETAAIKKVAADTAAVAYEQTARAAQEEQQAMGGQTAAYAAMAAAAGLAFREIIGWMARGVAASNEYANAMVGLRSIVEGTGNSMGAAKSFIEDFTADGLIPAADAATALKNLLARGYTDEQAIMVLNRFKDAAAFGRQGALSLGEAVKTASEGIKNENSVLVDNAGVTKNVAKMWEDYAKRLGKATTELTLAEKIQAEVNGIVEETAHQVGDAAKYAGEFSGAQSQFAAEGVKAWAAYGDAMKPVLGDLLGTGTDAVVMLREFIEDNKELMAGLTAGTLTLAGFLVVAKGIPAVVAMYKALTASVTATNVAMASTPWGWIALAAGALVGIAVGLASVESAAEKANRELQETADALSEMRNRQRSLNEVAAEYEALSNKVNRTAEEQKRLEQIERELVSVHGLTANSVNEYGEAVFTMVDALHAAIEAQEKLIQLQKEEALSLLEKTRQTDIETIERHKEAIERENEAIDTQKAKIQELQDILDRADENPKTRGYAQNLAGLEQGQKAAEAAIEASTKMVKEYTASLDEIAARTQEAFTLAADLALQAAKASGAQLNEALHAHATERVKELVSDGATYEAAVKAVADEVVKLAKEGFGAATEEAQAFSAEVLEMVENLQDASKASRTIDDIAVSLRKAAREKALIETLKTASSESAAYQEALNELASSSGISAETIAANLGLVEDQVLADEAALVNLINQMVAMSGVQPGVGPILTQLQTIANGADTARAAAANLVLQLMSLTGVSLDNTGKVTGLGSVTAAPRASASKSGGGGSRKTAYDTQMETLEHLRRLEAITEAEEIARLERIQKLYARTADQKRDIEERLYQARKDYQQKLYDDEVKALDNRKALGKTTVQEEIAALERIRDAHAKTTDQRIEIERRLYQAREELRSGEIEQVDRLNQGILSALQARYEEQQRIEQERIQASIDGWKLWADESKKAIQEQIDALDELNKTADRDAQDAEELRKIEATRQLIIYEKDAYNREQLEKELERQEAARAERLRKNAIEDEKARLRAQMTAVDEQAKAEQEALGKQMDQLDDAYAERLKNYNLQAEAERLIAGNNQKEILSLIQNYAPDYEATGKTLGERLYDGFKNAVKDITVWFDALNARIEDYQANIAQTALAAADSFYRSQGSRSPVSVAPSQPAAVNVYQEVHYHMPTDSPAEAARKLRQANEALGRQLTGG